MGSMLLKIVFILVNIILVVFGAVLIGIGAWVVADQEGIVQLAKVDDNETYESFSKPGLMDAMSGIAIVEGTLVILLSVLGFCGLGQENKCYLALYCGVLTVLVLLQIALIAMGGVLKGRLERHLRPALKELIKTDYTGYLISESKFSRALDKAQVTFECCGVDNYTEFSETATKWTDRTSNKVPKTCCKIDKDAYLEDEEFVFINKNCARQPDLSITHLDKSCYNDIEKWLNTRTVVLLALTVVFTAAQICGITVACCLLRMFKQKDVKSPEVFTIRQ